MTSTWRPFRSAASPPPPLLVMLLLLVTAMLLGFCQVAEARVAVPLSTKSRWIVDANGQRVKLACVNWSGAHMKDYVVGGLHVATLDQIAFQIQDKGFNCVRLQWSVEMYFNNPEVGRDAVVAMPELIGAKALDVYELTVNTLVAHGIMVILDNHVSDADWCCNIDDGNGLWYTNNWPEEYFFEAWRGMVTRFAKEPMVIAADLRNELRPTLVERRFRDPRWGSGEPKNDWHMAASRAAKEIQAINPNLLIIVQGTHSGKLLHKVPEIPVVLDVPNKLVYSVHDYKWFHPFINFNRETEETYQKYKAKLDENWGFLLEEGQSYTTPVWVGEFGTGHNEGGLNYWWTCLLRYLAEHDLDFSYWPIDGTQSRGTDRTFGAEEGYGILNMTWNGIAHEGHYQSVRNLIPPTQGPLH